MNPEEAENLARKIVGDAFGRTEYEEPEDNHGIDFGVSLDDVRLAVIVKATNRREVEVMKGMLATAILEWQKQSPGENEVPLIMLYAPRIGRRALRRLEVFMDEYAAELAWGVFDDRGTVHLQIPQLDVETTKFGDGGAQQGRQTTHNKRAFTDLNRWLLKVLLLRDAPAGMWHDQEEYRRPFENPADLQRVAKVSQGKAYQFARTFRDIDFLEWDRQTFRIPDKARLVERWIEDENQLGVERHPVRAIFSPEATVEDIFSGVGPEVHYAVGGFEACRLHGVLHTVRQTPEIHIFQNVNRVVNALELEICPEHEADFYLVSLPYWKSIQRGTLHRDELRVVDILQAALDAGRHQTRGREQAEFIIGEVLGWS